MNYPSSFLSLLLFAIFGWQCSAADSGTAQTGSTTSPPATAENANFTLKIAGLEAGKVRLVGILNDRQFIVDEATTDANGTVTFAKDEPYRQGIYFVLLPDNTNFQMVLAEDQTFTMTTQVGDPTANMKIEGSVDNQLFYDNLAYELTYRQAYDPLTQQLQSMTKGTPEYEAIDQQRQLLNNERKAELAKMAREHPQSFFVKFKQAGQNPELRKDLPNDAQVTAYRMEFWDGVDLSDERLMNTPVIYNKLKRYFEELTPQQPDSIVLSLERLLERLPTYENSEYYKYFVNYVALNYEPTKTTLMDSEAVFVHMVQNHFTYERAFWSDSTNTYALQLRAAEMSNSLIGQPGPNVKAPDPSGKIRAIDDLKAPYVVVYLYNPDCEHCQEQSPVLVNLYRSWQRQSPPLVDVYAIAVDTDDQSWKDYIAKTGMPWTNVFDPTNRAIYKTYYVDVTPEVYLLGPDRKIIAKNLNVNQINEVIERHRNK